MTNTKTLQAAFLRPAKKACLLLAAMLLPVQDYAATAPGPTPPHLDREALARAAYGNDAPWYLDNIPFLEIDDTAIQETYYYRWQVYHAHMRDLGVEGSDETEFLPSVGWARHPYEDLNDSSSFHILEGRWLRNPAYVEALVDHLYAGAGNDRHFSESIAAATYAWRQVSGDAGPALRHLDTMQHIYNLWDDHFDAARGLYWIEPLLDATEYTISSIDASGAGFTEKPDPRNNGFTGGFAFRPSINAYQYGNALAIASLAQEAGQSSTALHYRQRAAALQAAMQAQLWSPTFGHFIDMYQRSTPTVRAGEMIRGRELVGLVPWAFDLPPATSGLMETDAAAWQHALRPNELGGTFGLRTAEPTYARYLAQYRYDAESGLRECQWNGPSWPFQTSQTLTGLAHLLQNYPAAAAQAAHVSANDYVHLLRQYTRQHRLGDTLDLQEDYNPDTGAPIVGLGRSHHYLHSTYNDLIFSGLLGIVPSAGDRLVLQPLLPAEGFGERPIRFFAVENLRYHGHDLSVAYDADGSRYHHGKGLTVVSDGKTLVSGVPLGRLELPLGPPPVRRAMAKPRLNLAVNVWGREPTAQESDLPRASASSVAPTASLYEAIDGRRWFFPETPHGWSPAPIDSAGAAGQSEDWYAVDLRRPVQLDTVELAFFEDATHFAAPGSVRLEQNVGGTWKAVALLSPPTRPVGNGVTLLRFQPQSMRQFRIVLQPSARQKSLRLVALKAFGAL